MTRPLKKLFLVAGEASSDGIAAAIVDRLKEQHPGLEIFGVGGDELRKRGMDTVVSSEQVNMVGLTEWFTRWLDVWLCYCRTRKLIYTRKPDAALLIDLPDFNLMLAGHLKKLGIPTAYLHPPQIWAWRKYRVKKLRRRIDRVLVQFPFEIDFYRKHSVDAVYAGHPLSLQVPEPGEPRTQEEIAAAPRIAVLPGSRASELKHHGPTLKTVMQQLLARCPDTSFQVPVASTLDKDAVARQLGTNRVTYTSGDTSSVLANADLALVCSGTATLQAAFTGTPGLLFYKVDPFSYFMGYHFFGYKGFMGLPNVLSSREVMKEFIQKNFTPKALVNEAARLLEDPAARNACRTGLLACRRIMEVEGAPSEVAAQAVTALWQQAQEAAP